jgi:putative hemolysin
MSIVVLISAIGLLIAINAFYVAAEFSVVSLRRSRLAQEAESGNANASYLLKVVGDHHSLDTYVAACQVGITVSSLALGFYGQARILALLAPVIGELNAGMRILATSITAAIILLVLTTLQVILGELLPKNVGLLHPESLALMTAPGMRWSTRVLRPLIWLFNGSGRLVLRLMGADSVAEHAHIHSSDEIEILVEESSAGGVLDADERRLLVNTLRLRNVTAQRAMIPRNSMLAGPVSASCTELLALLAESPYSRLPVYSENIDSIIGALHIKDLLCAVWANVDTAAADQGKLEDYLRPVLFVPESADADEVMRLLQEEHQILAIVVDEYGGTAGMITLEDLIEEITGDFDDEFDVASPALELTPDNWLRVRGDVPVEDVVELLDVDFDASGVETVGGLVLSAAGRIPAAGDVVDVQGIRIRVDRVAGNRIMFVSVPLSPEQRVLISAYLEEQ